jgi:putative mRNA 3-end processing factor
VWVLSDDDQREADPTCPPLEPLRCDAFVTEATYARPPFVLPGPPLPLSRIRSISATS